MRPMKGARKIVVDDKTYWWLIGGAYIIIWDEEKKKYFFNLSEFTGWSWNEIERGHWKGYFSIKPKFVAEQIRKRFWAS